MQDENNTNSNPKKARAVQRARDSPRQSRPRMSFIKKTDVSLEYY